MNSFTLTFKTPDVMDTLTDEQKEYLKRYIKYDEIITIEFDPDNDTAEAVKL